MAKKKQKMAKNKQKMAKIGQKMVEIKNPFYSVSFSNKNTFVLIV